MPLGGQRFFWLGLSCAWFEPARAAQRADQMDAIGRFTDLGVVRQWEIENVNVDQVLSEVDYPVFVVTTVDRDSGERAGCLVGFVTQCSIDPARRKMSA